MRILVVTDGYPPEDRAAADLGCRDIVEGLIERGHRVQVLAAGSGRSETTEAGLIHRWLIRDRSDMTTWQDVFRKEVVNQTALRDLAREFQPEVALFFDLSRISAALPLLAGDVGIPACLHVGNDWLATWEMDRWFREQPQGASGRRALRYLSRRFGLAAFPRPLYDLPVIFTSRYIREATGRASKSSPQPAVIFPGVDVRRFALKKDARFESARLLYLGPIGSQSGIKTAIQALGILKQDARYGGATLTIAGPFPGLPDIVASYQNRAASAGVLRDVSFVDYSPDRSSPDFYLAHDFFVYPAARVESLTPSLLEAMACGLGVVSTATGGNAEILEDGVNALVIPPENPELCAQDLCRLLNDPALEKMLRAGARRTIMERFRLDQSLDAIENILTEIAGHAPADQAARVSANLPATSGRDGLRRPARILPDAERWLRRSGVLIRIRSLFKPNVLFAKMKSGMRFISCRTSLLFFPPVLKSIHKVLGRDRSGPKSAEPREILVVQPADLGDIVLSGPFLRNLRTFMPRSKIVLAVQPGLVNVVEKCPYVDEILPFNYRSFKSWENAFYGSIRWWLKGFALAVRVFSKHRFDLAVSLRWNDDAPQAASLILMAASGAPRRVAYINSPNAYKSPGRNGVNDLINDGLMRGAVKHEVEYQLDLLRFLGGRPEDTSLEVWTTADDDRTARDLLDKHRIAAGELLIALAPGARWEFRRWPADRFVELARWLQDDYEAKIVILAGKSERELAAEIERGLKPEQTVNLAGQTTIREMTSVLKFCRFFVGIDSGPMHVAVAAGVPVVGLFGAGEYNRFKPLGPTHAVVQLGLRCAPCPINCQFSEARCIRGIAVEQVKDVLKKKLAPQSTPKKAAEDERT
jgi:ADP-heptose:LPS heptosyltransferase/glycosyltransferase involved in cell wall biosynthesis